MVFVTFIEILLPNTSMKKYTRIILGLLMMTIILNPLLVLLKKDFSLSGYSFKFQNRLDSLYARRQTSDYTDKQDQQITKMYKNNLQNQMEQYLKGDMGDRDFNVEVEIIEDTESLRYGEITNVSLTIRNKIRTVESVDRVTIGGDSKNEEKDASKEYQGLINKISAMYNIGRDKIRISEEK